MDVFAELSGEDGFDPFENDQLFIDVIEDARSSSECSVSETEPGIIRVSVALEAPLAVQVLPISDARQWAENLADWDIESVIAEYVCFSQDAPLNLTLGYNPEKKQVTIEYEGSYTAFTERGKAALGADAA